MSSLEVEETLLTEPDGSSVGSHVNAIDVTDIECENITITGTLNGVALSGDIVFTDAVQTITQKTFADDSNAFANAADDTIQIFFDANGSTGTAATIRANQITDRTYSIPDSGADANFVMSEGTQTINGDITFTGTVTITGGRREYTDGAEDTIGATTADLYTIAMDNNTAYYYVYEVLAASETNSAAVFRATARAKRVAGVITVGTAFDVWSDPEAALSTASVAFTSSGANIIVRVTGVAAETIHWVGILSEQKVTF
jgi:autotransporter-associated beta strand protein